MIKKICFVFLCLFSSVGLAEEPKLKSANEFIRVIKNDKKVPVALQTAITRYTSSDGKTQIDLIGAVHIGDGKYYDRLNERFEEYDVLLYELFAPKNTRIPKGGKPQEERGITDMIFEGAKFVLDLESQVEKIDYTKENFVHADMSPEEMQKVLAEQGESAFTVILGVLADLLRQQNLQENNLKYTKSDDLVSNEEFGFFDTILDRNGPVKLKRQMSTQFENIDQGGLGGTLNRILVVERNKAAMKVLDQQIAKGKTKLALFYGAAHNPDFDLRLRQKGYKCGKTVWLTAWDMRPKDDAESLMRWIRLYRAISSDSLNEEKDE